MSESRQRFTGKLWHELFFWAGLCLLIWIILITLPLFTRELQIYRVEPWLIKPEDLTWKRLLFNLITKPGLKMMIPITIFGVVGIGRWMVDLGGRGKRSIGEAKRKILSSSMEWVIDGSKMGNLLEYGSFVRAL